jgi:hypothetical protein
MGHTIHANTEHGKYKNKQFGKKGAGAEMWQEELSWYCFSFSKK